jgi:hypothetical protein
MAEPLAPRLDAVQQLVAVDVAGICLASVADQHDIAVLCVVAEIADPIQILLLFGLVLKFLCLYLELLAFEPESLDVGSAVRTFAGIIEPLLEAVITEAMLALKLASVFDLVQAYCTLILFKLS